MENVLVTSGLKKYYGKHAALDGVNMHINRGDIYGFVGENGSGKTTIIRLISGLIFPSEGEFTLFGIKNSASNIGEARSRIGAIVESPSIYLNMSAYDNLKQQCILLRKDESMILPMLKEVGLEALYDDKKSADNYSLGMRQRLGIAMVLLGEPEFIILDEPMNGLDPAGIVGIREMILRLNREKGITFLISSHVLNELSLVATKYGIISKGRLLHEISAEDLRLECSRTTVLCSTDPVALAACVRSTFPSYETKPTPDGIKIIGDVDLNALFAALILANVKITSVNCSQTSFEEYYLSVIGGGRRD